MRFIDRDGHATDCVFCSFEGQPQRLFETPLVYVMPDKYPLQPGHTLVIAQEHLACYGAAPLEVLAELDEAAAHVKRFLEAAYGETVVVGENGIVGQTVFHAHLHLTPLPRPLQLDFGAYSDVLSVDDWGQVQGYFAQFGRYRFFDLDGKRYLVPAESRALAALRAALIEATGLEFGEHGWVKTTTPADVETLIDRWRAWNGLPLGPGKLAP